MRSQQEIVDAFVALHDAGWKLQRLKKNSKVSKGRWKALTRDETKSLAEYDPSPIAGFPSSVGLAVNDVDAHNDEPLAPRIKIAKENTTPNPICEYSTAKGQHLFYKMAEGLPYTKWEYGEIIVGRHYIRLYNPFKALEATRCVSTAEAADVSKLPPKNKESVLKEGNRNNSLFDEARDLERKGLLTDEKRKELIVKYRKVDLPLAEILTTLESGRKAGKKNPIFPRLDDDALKNVLEILGIECRYNSRSYRAELN